MRCWMNALALRPAEQVGLRHPDVLEIELEGVLPMLADLFQVAPSAEAREIGGLHADQRDITDASVASGLCHHQHEIWVHAASGLLAHVLRRLDR
jgi:hypothetical protein